jgi:hypothetical protein
MLAMQTNITSNMDCEDCMREWMNLDLLTNGKNSLELIVELTIVWTSRCPGCMGILHQFHDRIKGHAGVIVKSKV